MSRSVDLFVRSDLPIDQLADQLGRAIEAPLTPSPNGVTYILRDGAVVAELGVHPYVDDDDLLLSRYRYALSARVPNRARPQDTPEAAVLRRIGHVVRERNLFPVLLVMDLQYREGDGDQGQGATGAEADDASGGEPDAPGRSDRADGAESARRGDGDRHDEPAAS